MHRIKSILTCLTLFAVAPGCASYKLEPPAGFVEVQKSKSGVRMKASENAGLNVRVFDNRKGGTLAFWSEDLVHKLGKRGYALVGQSPVRSHNGLSGTRLDFAYRGLAKDKDEDKFYSAVLFVSDEHRVVLQLAGDTALRERYAARIDEIAGELRVRGCKVRSKICGGPQPETFAIVADQDQAEDAHQEQEG